MDEEAKENARKKELDELYVSDKKGGKGKMIEFVGLELAYEWRSDISQSRDITLQSLKISSLGVPGSISSLIPRTMNLYLDKNFLYSWDQFF